MGYLKLLNLAMTAFNAIMTMFRNAEIKQSGRDEVSAKNYHRTVKARDKAYEKVKSFDDAVAVALSRVRVSTSSDD